MTVKSVNNAGQVYSAQQNLKKADQKADAAAAEERAAQQGDVLELSSEMKNLKSIQDKIIDILKPYSDAIEIEIPSFS